MPFIFMPNSTFWPTVSQGNRACSWKIMMRSVPGPCTGLPSIRICPEVCGCRPAIKCNNVDELSGMHLKIDVVESQQSLPALGAVTQADFAQADLGNSRRNRRRGAA